MTTIPFLGEYISLKTKQKSNFKEKIKMKKAVKKSYNSNYRNSNVYVCNNSSFCRINN